MNQISRRALFTSLLIFIELFQPAFSAQPFSMSLHTSHEYFDTNLNISQTGSTKNGKVQAQFSLGKIRVQRVSSISNGWTNCDVVPWPNGGSLFGIEYYVVFSESRDLDDSGNYFAMYLYMNLDENGKILWNVDRPTNGIRSYDFYYAEMQNDRLVSSSKDFRLKEFFSQTKAGIISQPVIFSAEYGKKYYFKESLSLQEHIKCADRDEMDDAEVGSPVSEFHAFVIPPSAQTINYSIPTGSISLSEQAERIKFSASSGLPVQVVELDSSICVANGSVVILKKIGICKLKFTQSGGGGYAPTSKVGSFTITSEGIASRTINCVKGKLEQKVTGSNPKCRTGYKSK